MVQFKISAVRFWRFADKGDKLNYFWKKSTVPRGFGHLHLPRKEDNRSQLVEWVGFAVNTIKQRISSHSFLDWEQKGFLDQRDRTNVSQIFHFPIKQWKINCLFEMWEMNDDKLSLLPFHFIFIDGILWRELYFLLKMWFLVYLKHDNNFPSHNALLSSIKVLIMFLSCWIIKLYMIRSKLKLCGMSTCSVESWNEPICNQFLLLLLFFLLF